MAEVTLTSMRDAAAGAAGVLARRSGTTTQGLDYAEVVITMPWSMGASLAPELVETEMADAVAALEAAGAERGKAIVLANPAEVTPRVSLLCLVTGSAAESPAGQDTLPAAVTGAIETCGFVLAQPVQVSNIEAREVRTLLGNGPGGVRRIDMILQAKARR